MNVRQIIMCNDTPIWLLPVTATQEDADRIAYRLTNDRKNKNHVYTSRQVEVVSESQMYKLEPIN